MYIGVDFGTSFSQTSAFINGNSQLLIKRGAYGTPSVFYYDDIESELVGEAVEERGIYTSADNLVRDVKMKLDQTFNLDGKTYTAQDIVEKIYKEIITQAEMQGNQNIANFKIDGVVISHPAKFSMKEIGILADAVKNCIDPNNPIKVVGTIKEPVAAALTYYHADPQPDGTNILVFDLGGGTCDMAIVTSDKKDPAQFFVVDSDMEAVGGRDWDKALVEYVADKVNEENKGGDVRTNADYMEVIRAASVKAKHDLTKKQDATIRINFRSEQHNIKISRETFDSITVHLLERVLDKLDELFEKHANIAQTIKSVICVGGSSQMPQIKNGIKGRFPLCDVKLYEPEYAVVNGAAIFADRMISGFDFVPFSYGVRGRAQDALDKHVVKNIIRKGDRFPITCETDGLSIPAGQFGAKLAVYESECADEIYPCDGTKNEKLVGYIQLDSKEPVKRNERITCKLTINSLHTIEIEAHSETISDVTASFKLADI